MTNPSSEAPGRLPALKPARPAYACRECGTTINQRGKVPIFCGTNCRMTWHKRRMTRGAELYDFAMAWRYDRKNAQDHLRQLTQLLTDYHDADTAYRAGRRSWNPDEAQDRLDRAIADRHGKAGDGR